MLHGVNRSSTVYPCIQGWGLFDGPSDNASAAAIASWHTNAARLQLNEDCWLGINGVNPAYGGANYQAAIGNYVNLLQQNGLYVILSLAWNAPGTTASNGQQVMADADHAPAFWRSVATAFRYDPGVVFDLYNEPHDISWDCWLNGCTTSGGWQAAGMQTLVNAVRMAGATQPLLLSGVGWGNDLTQWLGSRPNDPANALVASFHEYDITACVTLSCWTSTVLPVAQVGGDLIGARLLTAYAVPGALAAASVIVDILIQAAAQFNTPLAALGARSAALPKGPLPAGAKMRSVQRTVRRR